MIMDELVVDERISSDGKIGVAWSMLLFRRA